MGLPPGTRFGPYEIVAPLGAGGMGEVYRATDTRLGRDVALKVLPSDALADEERRQRFVREARTASTLSHPNVATPDGSVVYFPTRTGGEDADLRSVGAAGGESRRVRERSTSTARPPPATVGWLRIPGTSSSSPNSRASPTRTCSWAMGRRDAGSRLPQVWLLKGLEVPRNTGVSLLHPFDRP